MGGFPEAGGGGQWGPGPVFSLGGSHLPDRSDAGASDGRHYRARPLRQGGRRRGPWLGGRDMVPLGIGQFARLLGRGSKRGVEGAGLPGRWGAGRLRGDSIKDAPPGWGEVMVTFGNSPVRSLAWAGGSKRGSEGATFAGSWGGRVFGKRPLRASPLRQGGRWRESPARGEDRTG